MPLYGPSLEAPADLAHVLTRGLERDPDGVPDAGRPARGLPPGPPPDVRDDHRGPRSHDRRTVHAPGLPAPGVRDGERAPVLRVRRGRHLHARLRRVHRGPHALHPRDVRDGPLDQPGHGAGRPGGGHAQLPDAVREPVRERHQLARRRREGRGLGSHRERRLARPGLDGHRPRDAQAAAWSGPRGTCQRSASAGA